MKRVQEFKRSNMHNAMGRVENAIIIFPLTNLSSSRKIQPYEIIYNSRRCRRHQKYLKRRRKVNMARYRIMYWKNIPQSFTVEGDGRTIKSQLSQKIQDKIDAYAMADGSTSTSDYAAQYKRGTWIERDGSPEEVAAALLSELEADAAKIEIPRKNGS